MTTRQQQLRYAYLRGSVVAISLFTALLILGGIADRITS